MFNSYKNYVFSKLIELIVYKFEFIVIFLLNGIQRRFISWSPSIFNDVNTSLHVTHRLL